MEALLASDDKLGNLSELLQVLGMAAKLPSSDFWPFQPVEVFWPADRTWYSAVVKKVHENCQLDVEFVFPGWWGVPLEQVPPDNVRPFAECQTADWPRHKTECTVPRRPSKKEILGPRIDTRTQANSEEPDPS